MKYHLTFGTVACFLILQVVGLNAQRPVSGYHLLKKVALGGEGGWDYLALDSRSRHLFISRATHVMVIDIDSGKSVGDIPNTAGVHGIALVPEMGTRARTVRPTRSLVPLTRALAMAIGPMARRASRASVRLGSPQSAWK